MTAPSVGHVVHYVSYGTPGGEYTSQCRAAIITAVHDKDPVPEHGVPYVDLAVMNPEGMFFSHSLPYNETAETAGDPDCANAGGHGSPFRYCACGWIEAVPRGGTWHWPERVE